MLARDGVRAAAAAVPRGRRARAADAADLDPGLRRAVPARRGADRVPTWTRRWAAIEAEVGRMRPAGQRPAAAGPAGRGAAAGAAAGRPAGGGRRGRPGRARPGADPVRAARPARRPARHLRPGHRDRRRGPAAAGRHRISSPTPCSTLRTMPRSWSGSGAARRRACGRGHRAGRGGGPRAARRRAGGRGGGGRHRAGHVRRRGRTCVRAALPGRLQPVAAPRRGGSGVVHRRRHRERARWPVRAAHRSGGGARFRVLLPVRDCVTPDGLGSAL